MTVRSHTTLGRSPEHLSLPWFSLEHASFCVLRVGLLLCGQHHCQCAQHLNQEKKPINQIKQPSPERRGRSRHGLHSLTELVMEIILETQPESLLHFNILHSPLVGWDPIQKPSQQSRGCGLLTEHGARRVLNLLPRPWASMWKKVCPST